MEPSLTEPPAVALVVDLDGTLVRSDLLHEAAVALIARSPLMVFALVYWLLGGKARLKREVFSRVPLEPEHLPFDSRVLELLRATPQRPRVLCTASAAAPAARVSEYLGLFEETIASDDRRNLAGREKADALVERFGERGFDYVANAPVDLHVWRHARRAWVVNAGSRVARAAAGACEVAAFWPPERPMMRLWPRALRLHQWLKNLLVGVPLAAAHRVLDAASVYLGLKVFLAFGLCASGVYLVNDLLDLDADRRHPRKRLRPLAAGTLPVGYAVLAAPVLMGAGMALAFGASSATLLALGVYLLLTFAYSLRLKRIALMDVVTLAGLYTIRIIAGAVAIGTPLSFWLLAFSMFIFLSLAMLKRFTELRVMKLEGRSGAAGRGYMVDDLSMMQSLGASSGFIAVLVLCLYINSQTGLALYHHPQALWLMCPMLLYWVSRAWLLANRGEMHDDPIIFAAKDRASQVVLLACAGVVLMAL